MFQSVMQAVRNMSVALFLSAALWAALFSFAAAENIPNFHADITVNADSSLTITETIQYDFGSEQRHGIFRTVLDQHAQPASQWFAERYIGLELISVTRDGVAEPYVLQDEPGMSLRIGDPNLTITSLHTYQVTYQVTGALATYADGTVELYWNVTGHDWPTSMGSVSVNVFAGEGVLFTPEQYCYAGSPGIQTKCDVWSTVDPTHSIFMEKALAAGSELTIAQSLTLPQPPLVLERYDSALLWFLGLVAWFSGFGVWLYRWRTRHRIERAVVAQYEPYEDFKPMFTGVLFDNRLDPRDLTASIVYLAQQGFLKITQTTSKVLWVFETTDYELKLLRSDSEAETALQKQVLQMLFSHANVAGKVMKLSDITKSQSRQRANYKLLQEMRKAAVNDLVERGFLEQRIGRAARTAVVPVAWFLFVVSLSIFDGAQVGNMTIIFAIVTAVTIVVFLLLAAERRTRRGYEALNHLKGFKDFLSTTEAERYKFHNAPTKNAEQFMEYLPYAIALGVEKEWAEVFKDIAINAPEWYSSPSGTYFNAAAFTTDIGSFATAFASSGASGSSGSSGGGFSGGGSGGGGGGSW